MTWVNALWLLTALMFIWMLYRMDRKRGNTYSFIDTLLDKKTGKADLYSHILWIMALMAIWVCIDRSNDGKDVDTLVLGVLGIFVTGRAVTAGVRAWRPEDGAPDREGEPPKPRRQA
jgi:hypothetical protein